MRYLGLIFGLFLFFFTTVAVAQTAHYPASDVISGIQFDMSTYKKANNSDASGSDNWPVTWGWGCKDTSARDPNSSTPVNDQCQQWDYIQYASWGDGGGFGGNVSASMGVARVVGTKSSYYGINLNGGSNSESGLTTWKQWQDPPEGGKCLGIIAIDTSSQGGQKGMLYLYRNGEESSSRAFSQIQLYKSTDWGLTWSYANVGWYSTPGFFSPAFLQFGKDNQGARDNYVYSYAPKNYQGKWEVQFPGEVILWRVPKDQMGVQSAYQYFSGTSSAPQWSGQVSQAAPVWRDPTNGVMRISVSYNAPLGRYILTAQQVSRGEVASDKYFGNYHIGIYEAPEPWGPWKTVFFGNPKNDISPSLNDGGKTVFWNFSNKWLSSDGRRFVMVYTGKGSDEWGSVEGNFITGSGGDYVAPAPPFGLRTE